MVDEEVVYRVPDTWDPITGGALICPGCQHGVAGKLLAEVLEEMGIDDRAVVSGGAGCNAALYAGLRIDGTVMAHGRGCDVATAVKRIHPDAVVFGIFGDGDCAAIGADPLIAALNRAERITVFMLNNAQYGSTGGQIAPTTLVGQKTPTSPAGRNPEREGFPMHVAEIIAQFKGVAYSARGALNTAANYQRTKGYMKTALQKQIDNVGFSFVEIITACPTQWHLTPVESLKWIEENMIPEFPLGEFKNLDKIE